MKTLKEWFDGLSPRAQDWVKKECSFWLDVSTETYYKDNTPSLEKFKSWMDQKPSGYKTAFGVAQLLALLKEKDPDIISDKEFNDYISQLREADSQCLNILPIQEIKDWYKTNKAYQGYYFELHILLFLTEDFNNIDWNTLRIDQYSDFRINEVTCEIVGIEKCVKVAKEYINKIDFLSLSINNEVFDRLFFGPDGWDKFQKQAILSCYKANQSHIEDFMKRIVAVDKSYLRSLYTIISKQPAIAAELYKLRKPDEELTGTETTEQTFRYAKEYRKLFNIAACCERKNIGKAMMANIGTHGPLLKLYSYNWDMIFDCLYPEYATPIVTEENVS